MGSHKYIFSMADKSHRLSMFTFDSPRLVEKPERRNSLFHLPAAVGNVVSSVFNRSSNITNNLTNTNNDVINGNDHHTICNNFTCRKTYDNTNYDNHCQSYEMNNNSYGSDYENYSCRNENYDKDSNSYDKNSKSYDNSYNSYDESVENYDKNNDDYCNKYENSNESYSSYENCEFSDNDNMIFKHHYNNRTDVYYSIDDYKNFFGKTLLVVDGDFKNDW